MSDIVLIRQEMQSIAVFGCIILLSAFFLLGFAMDWVSVGQWLLQAGLIWGYVCCTAWRRLSLNRASAESPIYRHLGWGNRLTILRGGLIAFTGGFLFSTPDNFVLLAAIFYTLAALLDRLDGFVARRNRQVSLLGNELDISFDALGLLIAPLLAIGLGKLHGSYLLLSAAYYVYQWGLGHRRKRGLAEVTLPPNPLRRTLAGFQMGFVAVALWPLVDPSLSKIIGIAFMLPVLFGFVSDWLVVCGKFQPLTYSSLESLSERFFQPGLRLLTVPLVFLTLQDSGAVRLTDSSDLLLIFSTGLILFGLAGRLGALSFILLLDRRYSVGASDLIGHLLIVTASWILLLGTGRFSLWRCGDEWLKRYDGADVPA